MLLTRRLLQLFVGLFLYGVAIALMVRAGIGVAPWDVLTQGIVRQTGLGFGLVVFLTSVLVLLLWIPLRQRPRFGTIANALLVGPFADLGLHVLPQQTVWWAQGLTFALGLLLLAAASGLYIGAAFGPGPRDGLMLGLHRRFGVRVGVARTAIEVTVLAIGWLLGGQVGIGTALEAVLIGPMVAFALPLFAPRATRVAAAGQGSAPAPSTGSTTASGTPTGPVPTTPSTAA
ncbi:hypothetical protein ES689_14320 [Frigoribacterium sp. ACAM 257]|uniref:membrane protein YczE n=1 Tax=Frigoribacterium sp. ACAM 257 TaxID=2508998 RepID=UPI0011BA33C4|nr:hypothetical protein [Frigoribacterium sp. ACAM 257]TWX35014.1 hypothetical protein ES689_14320 [Frigoribacterium sp. ACAM 257]